MKKAIIEFIFAVLICGSVIALSILFKSPLVEFQPLLNEIVGWFIENYIMVIIGTSVIFCLVLLKNLLLKN